MTNIPRLRLDIEIDDGDWSAVDEIEPMLAPLIEEFVRAIELPAPAMHATVMLATDAIVRELNKTWRQQDTPTNVLSFPSPPGPPSERGEVFLGDIILAHETLAREAAEQGIPLDHHFRHLVLHGLLHLAGHDHETDAEAEVMEALESRILAILGIPDPYAEP